MPLSKIKQTSRTLLIEEFNKGGETDDLYTLLRNENVDEKENFYSIIKNKLEVKSFKEFTEKFMPSVWEWMEQDPNSGLGFNFRYSLEKPEQVQGAHELKIDQNEFYKMVMNLYSKKSVSGESNFEFDYSEVAELLSPQKVMENAKQMRKDLEYNFKKLDEIKPTAKTEKNECIRKINQIRKDIVSQYKNSFSAIIKLALADTEKKLEGFKKNEDKLLIGTQEDTLLLPCKVEFDDKGELQVVPIENNAVEVVDESGNALIEDKIAGYLTDDYEKNNENKSEYLRNIIVSNYAGQKGELRLNREELTQRRDKYAAVYKQCMEEYIRAVSTAIEKILNVKVLFENATISGEELVAPIIVTNCKASKLCEPEVKDKFDVFIRENKMEKDDKKIWFAVIPAIGDIDFIDNPDVEESLDDLDLNAEDEVEDIKTTDGDVLVNLNNVKVLLEILKNGKITTFFNFRANETTGFSKFNKAIVENYRSKLQSLEGNEYAVFAYPNFTILPKKETYIPISNITDMNTGEDTKEYMDIPGIYVDSSYVAAGLMIGIQTPKYLEKKGFKIKPNNPDVRMDIEDGDNRFKLLTKMNREGSVMWPSDAEEEICKDMFGFCFCSNTQYFEGKRIKNTYVYLARNMNKSPEGYYEPLYKRLTMDFVMQYLRLDAMTMGGENKFKKDKIDGFIKKEVAQWKREAEGTAAKYDNAILKANEDIRLDANDNKLYVEFINGGSPIDVEILLNNKEE